MRLPAGAAAWACHLPGTKVDLLYASKRTSCVWDPVFIAVVTLSVVGFILALVMNKSVRQTSNSTLPLPFLQEWVGVWPGVFGRLL